MSAPVQTILLGYAGFVLALGLLGAWSARTLSQMSAVSHLIIAENYDSVVAAQDMKESLERQDSGALFDLLGQHDRARRQVVEHRARFAAALEKASSNITEVGEAETVETIRQGYDEYCRRFDAFVNATGDRSALYFQSLEPQFNHVRSDADGLLRLTLEAAGYQVEEAADGEAGLDCFQDGSEYDAVVLDQKMPGLDGLETQRRIKEHTPDACVVMVTAFASIELAVDAMGLGATDFLRKPMTPETLRGAVAAAIAGKASRRSLRQEAPPRPSGPAEIAVLTMNGFQILRSPAAAPPSSPDHSFRVRYLGDGLESTVTVAVDPEAVERVARLTHRRLEPGGGFWRSQAERLLSAYVWSEGQGPPDGRLVVGDVSDEDLDVAARWAEG